MRYLSLFSGIEAATQAWAPLGWDAAAFAEIEPFPAAVLAYRYPDIPNLGDVTRHREWKDIGPVDLICGGSPCQSFSVAGLRQGMADPRGNLILTYLAIVDQFRPRWIVYENVPGLLSSNGGRDFGSLLGGLGQLGYGFAYRVLDAQHVRTRRFPMAVPQRRRRVWVVGYLGDWRRAAAVLFDRESLSGNPPPRRRSGQVAPTIPARSLGGGGLGTDFDCDGGVIQANSGDAAYCLTASAQQSSDAETETLIAVAQPVPFDTTQITSAANYSNPRAGDPCHPLAAGAHPPAIAIQERAISENVAAGPDGVGVRADDAAYTLEARTVPQAVAFAENSRAEIRLCGGDGQVMSQLTTGGGKPGQGQPTIAIAEPYTIMQRGRDDGPSIEYRQDGTSNAILTPNGGRAGMGVGAIALPWAVRRLTTVETARLQGFPDDFTAVPWRGKPAAQCPDGPQYKAHGNSWPVNVATWLGERIAEVDEWRD